MVKKKNFKNKKGKHKKLMKNGNLSEQDQMEIDEVEELNSLQNFRKTLPIYDARESLIEEFKGEDTLIIIGETGSGKTTQIPQYIYESKLNMGRPIAVTQPRRVAAISLALRVSEEMGIDWNTGSTATVGYSVRFEDTTSEDTMIKYMTDGMLLREAMLDPKLKRYSWIVLDEAHERSIQTDVLFGIVKLAQKARAKKKPHRRLKLIIMSATMDVDHFQNYFDRSKIVYIAGRMHPLEIHYAKLPQEDYSYSTISTILQLHREFPPDQHFLAFLTGQEEIQGAVDHLKKLKKFEEIPMEVYPLFASLSQEDQLKAISIPTLGTRRIIISTNVAETSITIPGIRIVIDCGRVKARYHVGGSGIDVLKVVKISKTQALQRAGRAGRESSGKCYRLYTQQEYENMSDFTIPEIKRSNIANVILQIVKIGIKNPLSFDWIDSPSIESLQNAINELHQLEALQSKEEPLELTEIGKQMSIIPLPPPLAKVLVNSPKFCVVEPIVTILSLLSTSDAIFEKMYSDEVDKEFGELRKRFFAPEGDFICYLKIFREFRKSKNDLLWCKVHRFNQKALNFAIKVRLDLLKLCDTLGLDRQSKVGGEEMREQIRKCFYESLPHNLAIQTKGNVYKWNSRPGLPALKVKLHPSSVLFTSRPPFVLFTEITQLSDHNINYIRNVSLIDPHWLGK